MDSLFMRSYLVTILQGGWLVGCSYCSSGTGVGFECRTDIYLYGS